MKVRMAEPDIQSGDIDSVTRTLRAGQVSGKGKCVPEFERRFAKWVGARYGVATSNGTSAIHLALASLGVEPSDEVIIPALSMGAIPFAVRYLGAREVLADSEKSTWNISSAEVEKKISKRTRAIVAMHTYGHPVNMDPLMEIARKHGLFVVEDAAEALASEYKGTKVGSIGDVGCFSFYANKIITTGEGGMVVTSSRRIADDARALGDMAFGRTARSRFEHRRVGFNYRLSSLQAALGISQLARIEKYVKKKKEMAKLYSDLLGPLTGLELPPKAEWAECSYWMYSILVDKKTFGRDRLQVMNGLAKKGIESRSFFTPVHFVEAFSRSHLGESYPIAEKVGATGLNLPSGNTITSTQIRYVADTLRQLAKA